MSNIPNFASNKKCWRLINKLVFGEEVSCPLCGCELQETTSQDISGAKYAAKSSEPLPGMVPGCMA